MKLLLPLLVLAVLATCANAANLRQSKVTNFIDNAQILARIERLRADMRTGLGDDNTIWAPMDIDEYIYSYVVGLIGLEGPIRNIHIDGLDRFIVNSINFNSDTLRLDFDFTLPDVDMSGWYNLNGYLGELIPIFGTGNFFLGPRTWNLAGYFVLNEGPNNFLQMTDFYVRIGMRGLETDIEGLLLGDDLNNFLNVMLRDIIPQMFDEHHAVISENTRENFLPIANEYLSTRTLDDLMA